MKTIKYFAAAAAIALTSFATLAAEPINSQQADSLTATGVISAGHATTPQQPRRKSWPLKPTLRAPAATALSPPAVTTC